jgi:hypothetical protein
MVRDWLATIRLGAPRGPFVPLQRLDLGSAGLISATAAQRQGVLQVREKEKEGGIVGQVEACNLGTNPVLILEGDTLIGCRQNRVVAHTVVVVPGATTTIVVGCMERRRWSSVGRQFAFGKLRMDADVRRATVRETAREAVNSGNPELDQGRLWADVSRKLVEAGAFSASEDFSAVIERRAERSRSETLRIDDGEVGVIVMSGDRFVGIELLADSDLWREVAPRTFGSFLFDQLEDASVLAAERWLGALREASLTVQASHGEAEMDVVLRGSGLVGSGVFFGNILAHVAVFADA